MELSTLSLIIKNPAATQTQKLVAIFNFEFSFLKANNISTKNLEFQENMREAYSEFLEGSL